MTIVERLRDIVAERKTRGSGAITTINPTITGWLEEAADEIERLTLERNTVHHMQAEIERLRAALESLTHDPPQSLAREPDTDCEVVLKMRDIARRALENKP